jgi:hypothetical protein
MSQPRTLLSIVTLNSTRSRAGLRSGVLSGWTRRALGGVVALRRRSCAYCTGHTTFLVCSRPRSWRSHCWMRSTIIARLALERSRLTKHAFTPPSPPMALPEIISPSCAIGIVDHSRDASVIGSAEMDDSIYLTAEEVVERYRGVVSIGTLRNWRAIRVGPTFVKIGKAILYPVDELNAWERRNMVSCRAGGRLPVIESD